jgi:hypothetical protein
MQIFFGVVPPFGESFDWDVIKYLGRQSSF